MNKKFTVLFAAILAVGISMASCKESPEILIADPFFEMYCLTHFDKNGNGQIQKNEVGSVKSLTISGLHIQSLKGVEEFLSLAHLDCRNNQLVRLYLAKNKKLTTLLCAQNELPVLDVSNSLNLSTLDCSDNKITTLDLSKNKRLKNLNCICNPLSTIFVRVDFDTTACRYWNIPAHTICRNR
jgi:Leucine-rich repeat (LRR) protein